ncbi:MAG: carbohydrate ABC transporter permease [Anaerolineales bacterium]|nr:carbohydrate ABC transporter permease [Anaerolineales bacterium]
MTQEPVAAPAPGHRRLSRKVQRVLATSLITGLTLLILFFYLVPMVYGMFTAVKTDGQFSKTGAPIWPASEATFNYQGEDYEIYLVPIEGQIKSMALIKKGRASSTFIDPADEAAGPVEWAGSWRSLERSWEFDPQWENFPDAWNTINYPNLLKNTILYAVITTFGSVVSAALVAFGFARFRIPRKNVLFILMMSTVILPGAVTLIPTYFFWLKLDLVGTWWPLIIPAFFSWGTNVFLLRQFFLTIPRELDEAAMMDGANPLRIFVSVILPQSTSALTAVALFHFFYAWNDFFNPMIYLAGHPEKFPITIGLTAFNNLYAASINMIQAASLVSAVIPVLIFFFAQRAFMQGVVITGVEK